MLIIRGLLVAWFLTSFVLCVVALGVGLGVGRGAADDATGRGTSILAARLLCAVFWPLALFTHLGRKTLLTLFRKAA
jgi:hypothetical protein